MSKIRPTAKPHLPRYRAAHQVKHKLKKPAATKQPPIEEKKVCECCIQVRALISLGLLGLVGFIALAAIKTIPKQVDFNGWSIPGHILKTLVHMPIVMVLALSTFLVLAQSIQCARALVQKLLNDIFGESQGAAAGNRGQDSGASHHLDGSRLGHFNSWSSVRTVGAIGVTLIVASHPELHTPEEPPEPPAKKPEVTFDVSTKVQGELAPIINLKPQLTLPEKAQVDLPIAVQVRPVVTGQPSGGMSITVPPQAFQLTLAPEAQAWLQDLKIAFQAPKPDPRLEQLTTATTHLLDWSRQTESSLAHYEARQLQMNASLTRLAVETNFAQRVGFQAVQSSQSTQNPCQVAPWRDPAELKACDDALRSFSALHPPALKASTSAD